jgi:hypothetical protein
MLKTPNVWKPTEQWGSGSHKLLERAWIGTTTVMDDLAIFIIRQKHMPLDSVPFWRISSTYSTRTTGGYQDASYVNFICSFNGILFHLWKKEHTVCTQYRKMHGKYKTGEKKLCFTFDCIYIKKLQGNKEVYVPLRFRVWCLGEGRMVSLEQMKRRVLRYNFYILWFLNEVNICVILCIKKKC